MGLKLVDDKLGIISESAGNIILAPSILTLRDAAGNPGQQFRTVQLQVALPAFSNVLELHFVYMTAPGGAPQLVTSLSPNSVGPGASTWRFVGAFYTGADNFGQAAPNVPRFGAFVTIEGPPRTPEFSIGESLFRSTVGTLTSAGSKDADFCVFSRNGKTINQKSVLDTGSGTLGSAAGAWAMPLGGLNPSVFHIDDSQYDPFIPQPRLRVRGSGYIDTSDLGKDGVATFSVVSGDHLILLNFDQATGTNNLSSVGLFDITLGTFEMSVYIVNVPIKELSETPLIDL